MIEAIAFAARLFAAHLIGAMAAGLVATAAIAAEPPTTIVIFDGSGSMWGKLDGERDTKFANARDALRRALPKVAPQSRVGLAAFGHRRRGDCSDTEIMLPPEPVDTARIMALLEKFNPRGKGPLVAAMKEAGASIAKAPGATSLILIHDDPDNCAQDPCAAADELEKANPKLAIHVVSIGLSKADSQRMACVPRITGGRHFDVQDVATLGTALDEAFRLAGLDARNAPPGPGATATKPAGKQAPPAPEDNGPSGLKLSATLGPGGPAVIVPLAWRVSKAGAAAGSAPISAVRAATLDLPLAAGSYLVEAQHGLVKATETVEVKARGATRIAVPFQAGAVRVAATLQKGTAPLEQAVFSITDVPAAGAAARTVWSGGADAPPVFLPVGTWRVTAELDRARVERLVTITPGALIDAGLIFGAGRLRAKATDRDGGQPLERVTFRVTEDDADSPDGRREVARSAAVEPEFTLAAGTYYLSARQGQAEVRERVLVNAGDDVSRTLVLPLGRLTLQSRLAGAATLLQANVGYHIERTDMPQEPIASSSPTARIELPAGRYRVESVLGGLNARVSREIDIRAGASTPLSFDHLAGTLQMKTAGGRVPTAGEVLWIIRDDQDKTVWQSLQTDPRAYLAPGRYKITAESRDRRGVAEIEVKSGAIQSVEIPLE